MGLAAFIQTYSFTICNPTINGFPHDIVIQPGYQHVNDDYG